MALAVNEDCPTNIVTLKTVKFRRNKVLNTSKP